MAVHTLQVYALDWSPDGERLASGSKDRLIKMYSPSPMWAPECAVYSNQHHLLLLLVYSWRN